MTTAYYFESLTGGSATDLDGVNGGVLVDGDFAIVAESGTARIYKFDADSGATASIPSIIEPVTNAGDGRWILQAVGGAAIGVKVTATGDVTIAAVPYDVTYYIDPDGESRNIVTTGDWTTSVKIAIYNLGELPEETLIFNNADSPVINANTPAQFGWDESTWRRWL